MQVSIEVAMALMLVVFVLGVALGQYLEHGARRAEDRFQEAYALAGAKCPAPPPPPPVEAKPIKRQFSATGHAVQSANGVAIVGVVVELKGRKVMLPMQWPPYGQNLN